MYHKCIHIFIAHPAEFHGQVTAGRHDCLLYETCRDFFNFLKQISIDMTSFFQDGGIDVRPTLAVTLCSSVHRMPASM